MQIREIRLQHFKRFTDLTISHIPADAKLVLLVGTNGCGKSSVFDAFNWLAPRAEGHGLIGNEGYFTKNNTDTHPRVQVETTEGSFIRDRNTSSSQAAGKFYGRSSLRIMPRLSTPQGEWQTTLATNADTPHYFIDQDTRFTTDVHVHADLLNQALQRLLVEGKANQGRFGLRHSKSA